MKRLVSYMYCLNYTWGKMSRWKVKSVLSEETEKQQIFYGHLPLYIKLSLSSVYQEVRPWGADWLTAVECFNGVGLVGRSTLHHTSFHWSKLVILEAQECNLCACVSTEAENLWEHTGSGEGTVHSQPVNETSAPASFFSCQLMWRKGKILSGVT